MSAVRIRPARADEGERLREIAVAAKSHWGYDLGQVDRWAAQGDFSPRALREKPVLVAEADGCAVAFAALIPGGETCVERARELGAERMEWDAEPNAVGFYERMGARRLRESSRTTWGRRIPVTGRDL